MNFIEHKAIRSVRTEVAGHCACMHLRKASRIVSRLYDDKLKSVHLKNTQFTTLSVLAVYSHKTLAELADIMGMDRTTLVRNLKPLKRDNLVEYAIVNGKQSKNLTLSAKGMNTLEQAIPLWREAQEEAKLLLGENTWHALQNGLMKFGV